MPAGMQYFDDISSNDSSNSLPEEYSMRAGQDIVRCGKFIIDIDQVNREDLISMR